MDLDAHQNGTVRAQWEVLLVSNFYLEIVADAHIVVGMASPHQKGLPVPTTALYWKFGGVSQSHHMLLEKPAFSLGVLKEA